MPRLLILEDEAVLRASMARGLRKVPGLEVVEAGSMAEAVGLLDTAPPDLVFSDIDLPDRAGLEILGELGRRHLKVPVVFISAFLKAYGPQVPRHANVEVRSKPVSVEELRRIVTERLGRTAGAAAAPFSAVDYLQLAGLGRHTVELELRRNDLPAGSIEVVAGEPWSAQDAQGSGVEAFLRIAFASDGAVECRTLQFAPRPRNIDARMEELLMEGARLVDEGARTGTGPEPGPELAAPPPTPPPVRAARPTETSPDWRARPWPRRRRRIRSTPASRRR